jgi:hypothetical protein
MRRFQSTRVRRFPIYSTDRVRAVVAAAGWTALIMLSGQLLIASAAETIVILSPETVRSNGYVPVHVAVVEVAQFFVAALAGSIAQRRMPGRHHGGIAARRHLAVAAVPVATILVIDVLAVIAASTPWWRLLLDGAVTGLGAVLGGMRARRR